MAPLIRLLMKDSILSRAMTKIAWVYCLFDQDNVLHLINAKNIFSPGILDNFHVTFLLGNDSFLRLSSTPAEDRQGLFPAEPLITYCVICRFALQPGHDPAFQGQGSPENPGRKHFTQATWQDSGDCAQESPDAEQCPAVEGPQSATSQST